MLPLAAFAACLSALVVKVHALHRTALQAENAPVPELRFAAPAELTDGRGPADQGLPPARSENHHGYQHLFIIIHLVLQMSREVHHD
jgi:hypothetical protein